MRRQQFALFSAEARSIGQQRIERPVCRNQLARALLADPGNAFDVVDGVAHQREDVHHLFRGHAELGFDPFGVIPRALVARVEHADVRGIVYQLKEVLVARHDGDRPAIRHGTHGKRADDVICLETRECQHLHAERFARLVHVPDLFGEVRWHRRAVGLVVVAQL